MKNFKNYLWALALGSLFLTSCSKEELANDESGITTTKTTQTNPLIGKWYYTSDYTTKPGNPLISTFKLEFKADGTISEYVVGGTEFYGPNEGKWNPDLVRCNYENASYSVTNSTYTVVIKGYPTESTFTVNYKIENGKLLLWRTQYASDAPKELTREGEQETPKKGKGENESSLGGEWEKFYTDYAGNVSRTYLKFDEKEMLFTLMDFGDYEWSDDWDSDDDIITWNPDVLTSKIYDIPYRTENDRIYFRGSYYERYSFTNEGNLIYQGETYTRVKK